MVEKRSKGKQENKGGMDTIEEPRVYLLKLKDLSVPRPRRGKVSTGTDY